MSFIYIKLIVPFGVNLTLDNTR